MFFSVLNRSSYNKSRNEDNEVDRVRRQDRLLSDITMPKKSESKVIRQGSTKNLRLTVRFATIEELEKVEAKAKECGFATEKQNGASGYLKSLASAHKPKSVFDHQVMQEICVLHAHLGRVGGLLKLAIREGWGEEIKVHISEINKTQRAVKNFILNLDPER